MSVKITALEAENVKRIKAVALTPSPTGLTLVGGNNNQGKTSVLDALAWALGGERFRPTAAQRDGAVAPAHLKVTLSNGVVVERKGKNASLTVTDPTGRRSGQQLLNAFVEPLALDLPRFMDASDKEKADILLRIIGIGAELHTRDLEIKGLYDKRTFTGQLEASIRDIEETNRKVRANLEKSRAEDEAAQYASEYDRLTESIQQKRAERMALLNGADLPLPGLSVEDGVLTYKGKHWRDISGSDQLRGAAAIVRRLNPDCGFVLLDKLEQMDMTTLQEFSAWLEAEGLQAIATRVSTGSECQIIIEDGMVKDAVPPEEKPQPRSWTKGAF